MGFVRLAEIGLALLFLASCSRASERATPPGVEVPTAPSVPVAPAPSPPPAPPPPPPPCTQERIDDLCSFLAAVTRGLSSDDPFSLACRSPEGMPRVTWGDRTCVAWSTGERRPFSCSLPWPGDDKLGETVSRDTSRLARCLPGWEVTKGIYSAELKNDRLRCELVTNLQPHSYALVCSRRHVVGGDQ
jgi:hypothetical protein